MPDVAPPNTIAGDGWSTMFERRFVPGARSRGRAQAWLRMVDAIGDDPVLQACALTYVSDDLPTDAVVTLHPDLRPDDVTQEAMESGQFWSASLDHAIWFHRPLRAEEWHLHDVTSHGYLSSRGVSLGHVLTEDGSHVATVAQEILFRTAAR
jgi:acyl-CoA thioesterase-2